MSLLYLAKHSIRVLQVNGNETLRVHCFKFKVLYTLEMMWFEN